jgi:IS5 family transposase
MLEQVNTCLVERGVRISTGTIVDTMIIHAPARQRTGQSSGMKRCVRRRRGSSGTSRINARVGVDSKTRLVHAVVATAANTEDSRVLPQLLHGMETRVWSDQAYRGQRQVIHAIAPRAHDFMN